MGPLLAAFLISTAINVIAYVIMPKPKTRSSDAVRELEYPTAESGKPMTKVFGTVLIKSPNVLHYTDKATKTFKIDA